MTNHLRADGSARGKSSPTTTVVRPALMDITGACVYLGNIGRSKFYKDLLRQLDIVRLGTRTLVTIESLDKLIAANKHRIDQDAENHSLEAPRGKPDSRKRSDRTRRKPDLSASWQSIGDVADKVVSRKLPIEHDL